MQVPPEVEAVAEAAHETDRAVSFRHPIETKNEDAPSQTPVGVAHTSSYINRLRI